MCQRWFLVDSRNRQSLSLKAKTEIVSYVPSLFTRFDSINKLALRCDRKSISLNDEAFVMISIHCQKLQQLKIRGCREITDKGMAAFAKNCKDLKKLSCGSCSFGVKGIYKMLNHCLGLESIEARATLSSLKSICLKEMVFGNCFEQLVMGAKKLKTLKIIRCIGDWDKVFEVIGGNDFLVGVHLERILDLRLFVALLRVSPTPIMILV